jgi:hypothetical protein
VARALQFAVCRGISEVDQGSPWRCDWKPTEMPDVRRRQLPGSVDPQPRTAAFPNPDGHVDLLVIARRQQVPHHGRRPMADCGRVAAGQHRGHLARERHKCRVPYRVYAAMEPVEVVLAQARVDRTGADPHRE